MGPRSNRGGDGLPLPTPRLIENRRSAHYLDHGEAAGWRPDVGGIVSLSLAVSLAVSLSDPLSDSPGSAQPRATPSCPKARRASGMGCRICTPRRPRARRPGDITKPVISTGMAAPSRARASRGRRAEFCAGWTPSRARGGRAADRCVISRIGATPSSATARGRRYAYPFRPRDAIKRVEARAT